MDALIRRDILMVWRSPGQWLTSLGFFAIFLFVSIIALGANTPSLMSLGPELIWLACIFSLLLSLPELFQSDFEDGSLEHLILSGIGSFGIVLAKAITFFSCNVVPLLFIIPFASLWFGLDIKTISATALSILFAAPAITAYGVMSAAILSGNKQSGMMIILITLPFLIPVVIFGLGAVDSYAENGLRAVEFQALIGLGLIALAVGIPAAAAAIKANLE